MPDAELNKLREYLLNPGTESAKDYLVFPIFNNLFKNKFKKQSDANGADIYIEGKLLVELKSEYKDWIQGFYQALHYTKQGLTFSAVCVIAKEFIAVWKVNSISDHAKHLSSIADSNIPPSTIGVTNSRKTTKAQVFEILNSAIFKLLPEDLDGLFKRDLDIVLPEFVQTLKNLDAERIQINTHNFIDHIEQMQMKRIFEDPLDAVHCFYAIVGFWDVTSTVAFVDNSDKIRVCGKKGSRLSEEINIKPRFHDEFKKFVESRFVFTNEGSGLTVDYYFSRFDEVITRLKPDYAKQHGIFFTDHNLSKFALWFVHEFFEKRLSDRYIVLDPAGGSGNLVTSWRGHLKRKIISELQPDLLKTIERRMRLDPEQIQGGFTIIPKTSTNEGLNFLDKSAGQYLNCLMAELKGENFKFDKPIAFLLNPPYKNTDENEEVRGAVQSDYQIHPSIIEITGEDAGRERYLAFLGQIINIARVQMGDIESEELNFENIQLPEALDTRKVVTPLILIFTPTSWLIPRPTYVKFRKTFDKYFKYEKGFIILGNEFFKIKGRFPISFTIWSYQENERGNRNKILLRDLTHLRHSDLAINWNLGVTHSNKILKELIKTGKNVCLDNSRGRISDAVPMVLNTNGSMVKQTRLNIYRNKTKEEVGRKIISGFPLEDPRHAKLKVPYGYVDGEYIGFMDDATPIRIKMDAQRRISKKPDRVWFYLDNRIIALNILKIFSGPPDKYGYCAIDLSSAKRAFCWFGIAKAINARYPAWANQFDIWPPKIPKEKEKPFYSLCFALGLSENRCVVTRFEKDNPVKGAPEIFIDNPLCPINQESFWATTLDSGIIPRAKLAEELVSLIKQLYRRWNEKYCKGQHKYNVGLHNEPYFKYFGYKDFITPYSGLIQIRKYSDINNSQDMLELFEQISAKTSEVRDEIYRLLTEEFSYFE